MTASSASSTAGASTTLPGLGFTIARYNAGGSSWRSVDSSHMVASPNIPKFKQMQGFWEDWSSNDPGDVRAWNWTVDSRQRAMAQAAVARGATHIELFSNSPMWWACDNHNPSGSSSGSADNLQTWNHEQHAAYLATVAAQAPHRWGFSFDSVEAFNEPISNWWRASGTQEGCHFDHTTQADVALRLRRELDARGLAGVNVAASDENQYDEALATWQAFNASVRAAVQQVNTHGYQQGGGRRDLLYAATRGKQLWNSEYGESDTTGLTLASNLNLDFRWLHNTAWVYWQVLDGSGWGLIAANPASGTYSGAATKYYVMAQYSRHIRPGMTLLGGSDENTVKAHDAANKRLVLVTVNYKKAQTVTYDLSGFGPRRVEAGALVKGWYTTTAGGDNGNSSARALYKTLPDSRVGTNFTFNVQMCADCVYTFEVEGVEL